MPEKEMKLIIKILGLIGAIFALIAQFVPWASGAYLFGADFYLGWDIFYIRIMGLGFWQLTFLGIIMIILFFLNLALLIIGFLSFKKVDTMGSQIFLRPAILATIEVVLYIVAVSIVSGSIGVAGFYGIGFIMILIAMIMFYIVFGLGRAIGISAAPGTYQQPQYYQPMYQQPPAYAQQPPPPPPPQQATPTPQPQPQPQQKPKKEEQAKTTKKFCPNCGNPLTPNAKFCSSCGNKI